MVPDAAVKHYKAMQRLQALVVLQAADLWAEVRLSSLDGSWAAQVPLLVPALADVQVKAATAGASYGAETLAQQGLYEVPEAFVNPAGFAGVASDGRSLEGLLWSPIPHVKTLISGGLSPAEALKAGGKLLTTLTRTQVADAGRAAAGVDTAARPRVGYVRMLNPPSCARCSILAGRFYRWNAGFNRHPRCDCIHVQSTARAAANSEGLVHDPYEYFNSLSEAEQDKNYTKAGAQAIRDGADISQVVNSRRGMKFAGTSVDSSSRGQKIKGSFTSEGTTKRGNFRANTQGGSFTKGRRLTPEAIYELNGDNRSAALNDLEKYGYILPGGQNPLGALRGQREGFGQLGHGGAYEAARQRIYNARLNGRDPNERYTMTAAERRLFDAEQRWLKVQRGENPYAAPSMSKRIKVTGQPLTPQIAAQVEKDYRRWLATGGQVF